MQGHCRFADDVDLRDVTPSTTKRYERAVKAYFLGSKQDERELAGHRLLRNLRDKAARLYEKFAVEETVSDTRFSRLPSGRNSIPHPPRTEMKFGSNARARETTSRVREEMFRTTVCRSQAAAHVQCRHRATIDTSVFRRQLSALSLSDHYKSGETAIGGWLFQILCLQSRQNAHWCVSRGKNCGLENNVGRRHLVFVVHRPRQGENHQKRRELHNHLQHTRFVKSERSKLISSFKSMVS